MTDGQDLKTGGAFQDVPQKMISVDWKRAEFEAARAGKAGK
jgi:hypothetical protein